MFVKLSVVPGCTHSSLSSQNMKLKVGVGAHCFLTSLVSTASRTCHVSHNSLAPMLLALVVLPFLENRLFPPMDSSCAAASEVFESLALSKGKTVGIPHSEASEGTACCPLSLISETALPLLVSGFLHPPELGPNNSLPKGLQRTARERIYHKELKIMVRG